MAILQLIRIKDGKETVLEITEVPDSFLPTGVFYSAESIEELEKHYKKTGKPKKSYIDVLYICRPQVEKWTIEELERYAPSLEAAKLELERRRI